MTRTDLLELIDDTTKLFGAPIAIVHGCNARPTPEMLEGVNLPVYFLRTAPLDNLYLITSREHLQELFGYEDEIVAKVG